MEPIVLENISKKYNGNWVLSEINHEFAKGEAIAFIGHNGCGKSTLLKIIAGLVSPTCGKVTFEGNPHFAYLPGKFPFSNLSSRSFLKRMCEIDGMPTKDIDEKIDAWEKDFFLYEMLNVPMKTLSKGTLQKIGVIQALIKEPDILLLDEPLSGQDVDSQKIFIEKIIELKNKGVTVFMACHEIQLVDALADKVFTIQNGKLVSEKGAD